MLTFFEIIDLRERGEYEYQIRWIGGPVYYKRKKGTSIWQFCTDQEFAENVNCNNLVKWEQ